MQTKRCPKCGQTKDATENYCTRCGLELETAPNTCSEAKTALCSHRVYAAEDRFCAYCGALTTYWTETARA